MTSWHPSRGVLLVLVLGALAASGCGSSGGSGSSTATRPPAGGFIAQLNAACHADVVAIRSAPKTVGGEVPAEQKFIRELHGLTPPPSLRPIFSQYVSLLEQNLATFERHDVPASKSLMARITAIVVRLRHHGATSC